LPGEIGGVYDPRDITIHAWQAFAEEAGAKALKPIVETLRRMASEILDESVSKTTSPLMNPP